MPLIKLSSLSSPIHFSKKSPRINNSSCELTFEFMKFSKNLILKVANAEIDQILKQYKKLKKKEKSNLSQVKKLGLVDKHGRPL